MKSLSFLLFLVTFLCTANVLSENSNDIEPPISTPEQLAALYANTEAIVGGLISPLSGQRCLSQTDLVARGQGQLTTEARCKKSTACLILASNTSDVGIFLGKYLIK